MSKVDDFQKRVAYAVGDKPTPIDIELANLDALLARRGLRAHIVPGALPGEPAAIIDLEHDAEIELETEEIVAAAHLHSLLADLRDGVITQDQFESHGGQICQQVLWRMPFDTQQPEEIWLNGTKIFSGSTGVAVIYNNLVGVNIEGDGRDAASEYGAYMKAMAEKLGVSPFEPGDQFMFRSHGVFVDRHVWCREDLKRITQSDIDAAVSRANRDVPTGTELANGGTNHPGRPACEGQLGVFRSPYAKNTYGVDVAEKDRYGQLRWVALPDRDPRYSEALSAFTGRHSAPDADAPAEPKRSASFRPK